MFLKLKNYEAVIKVIGFIYGRKQQNWLSKDITSLATISTKGLMLSCMIETMEGWDVITADIPGAFLQTGYENVDRNINI